MHGPDAARIMREDLLYDGDIIGILDCLMECLFNNDCLAGVTGNALPKDIATFISSGANQVITKPLTRSKLIDSLKHRIATRYCEEK